MRINFSLNFFHAIDRAETRHYPAVIMSQADLDQLRLAYKQAVDEWVGVIREEETLATPIIRWSRWRSGMTRTSESTTRTQEPRQRAMLTKMRFAARTMAFSCPVSYFPASGLASRSMGTSCCLTRLL